MDNKKKYLYNSEKDAYVEITDENRDKVKEKYNSNPSIYKIYESEGVDSMGKPEGSQEPLEQSEGTTTTSSSETPSPTSKSPYDIRSNDVVIDESGEPSTVKMATETFDGKNWHSFPTLFPKDPNNQTNNPDDWISYDDPKEAYAEAKKRGEVWDFNEDKEGAIAFGEGSWKKPTQEQSGEGEKGGLESSNPITLFRNSIKSDINTLNVNASKISELEKILQDDKKTIGNAPDLINNEEFVKNYNKNLEELNLLFNENKSIAQKLEGDYIQRGYDRLRSNIPALKDLTFTTKEDFNNIQSEIDRLNNQIELDQSSTEPDILTLNPSSLSVNLPYIEGLERIKSEKRNLENSILELKKENEDILAFQEGYQYFKNGEEVTRSTMFSFLGSNEYEDLINKDLDKAKEIVQIKNDIPLQMLLHSQELAGETGEYERTLNSAKAGFFDVFKKAPMSATASLINNFIDAEDTPKALEIIFGTSETSPTVAIAKKAYNDAEKQSKETGQDVDDLFTINYDTELKKISDDIRGQQLYKSQDIIDLYDEGDYAGFINGAAKLSVESSSYLTAAMIPLYGTGIIANSVAINSYYDLRRDGVSPEKAKVAAGLNSLVAVADNFIFRGMVSNTLKDASAVVNNAKKVRNITIANEVKLQLGKTAINNLIKEPSTEFIQGSTESIINQWAKGEPINYDLALRQGAIEASAAAPTTTVFSATPGVQYLALKNKDFVEIQSINKQIEELLSIDGESVLAENRNEQLKLLVDDYINIFETTETLATKSTKKEGAFLASLTAQEAILEKMINGRDVSDSQKKSLESRLKSISDSKNKVLDLIDKRPISEEEAFVTDDQVVVFDGEIPVELKDVDSQSTRNVLKNGKLVERKVFLGKDLIKAGIAKKLEVKNETATETTEQPTADMQEGKRDSEEVQQEDNEVKTFAKRIANGEDVTAKEDAQFYENNKSEIEAELKTIQDLEAKAKQEDNEVSDYIKKSASDTRVNIFTNDIESRVDNAENVNEEEILDAQEQIIEELDRVEQSDYSDNAKATIVEELNELYNKLDNYEFKTETTTKEFTQRKATRSPIENKREQKKSPQERITGRKIRRIEGDEFAATVEDIPDTQKGKTKKPTKGAREEVTVIEETDEGLVIQSYDKNGNKTTANKLEAESMNDFELVETTKDENGTVTGAILRNKNNDGEVFAIDDADLAYDLAIEKNKAELGKVEVEEFVTAVEQVEKSIPQKESKAESKPKEEAKVEPTTKQESKPKETNKPTEKQESKEQKIKQASKDISSKLRQAKFIKTMADLNKLQSDPTGLLKVAWDGTIEIAARTIEAGGTIAQAVSDGVTHIKETDWYKGLSEEGKKKADAKVKRTLRTELKNEATPEKLASDLTTEKEARNELSQYAGRQMVKNKVGGLTRGKVKTFMRAIRDVNKNNFVELAGKLDEIISKDAANRKESEYDRKRNRVIKNAKNFGKWGGIFKDFAMIEQSLVPENLLDEYNELLDRLSKRGAKLENIKEDIDLALRIMDSVNKQYDEISAEQEAESDKDSEERKEEIKDDIISMVSQIDRAGMSDMENNALDVVEAITEEDLAPLTENELKQVRNGVETASLDYVSPKTIRAALLINASRQAQKLHKQSKGIDAVNLFAKLLGAGYKSLKITSLWRDGQEQRKRIIRKSSSSTIDAMLGMKGDAIETILEDFELGYGQMEFEIEKAMSSLNKAYNKMYWRSNRVKADINTMIYMVASHFDSNPNNNTVHSVNDILTEIQKPKNKARYIKKYGEKSYKHLEDTIGEFTKDGKFDTEEFYNSLSKQEKGIIKVAQDINNKLEQYAYEAKVLGRGENIDLYDNYVHYNVLTEALRTPDAVQKFLESGATNASTKGGSLEARTKGVKPIGFSLIESMGKSVKHTLMDYHLTTAYRQEKKALSIFERLSEQDGDISFAQTLKDAVQKQRELLLERSYGSATNPLVDFVQASAYRYLLGTARRFVAETASNLTYVSLSNLMNGKNPFKGITSANLGETSEQLTKLINKLGSSHKKRLIKGEGVAGYGDIIASELKDGVLNPMDRGNWQKTTDAMKYLSNPTRRMSELLIETPDNKISRSIWYNSIQENFKKQTGKDLNLEKAINDSEYFNEYRKDLKQAAKQADREIKKGFSTTNKAAKSLAQLEAAKSGSLLSRIKYFMLPFIMNEYEQITKSTVNDGWGSAATTVPVLSRMAAYGVIGEAMAQFFAYSMAQLATLLEDDEDEYDFLEVMTKDTPESLKKNMVSATIATMIFRNMNGGWRIPMNSALEFANMFFGDDIGLRKDKEYDKYKHSLVFNKLTADTRPEDILFMLAPEAAPLGGGVIDVSKGAGAAWVNNQIKEIAGIDELKEKPITDKQVYRSMKGWLTILSANQIIPRDLRDTYVYYKNRDLILKGNRAKPKSESSSSSESEPREKLKAPLRGGDE